MSLTYLFSCDNPRCYAENQVEMFTGGSEPRLPIGWSEFEGKYYCPRHGVVDPEDQPEA